MNVLLEALNTSDKMGYWKLKSNLMPRARSK